MVSNTLNISFVESEQLISLIYEKSKGNPLYVKHFVKHLYDQGLIFFCNDERKWKWKECILDNNYFEADIFELFCKIMLTMKDSHQDILKVASCLARTFPLSILRLLVNRNDDIDYVLSTGIICRSEFSDTSFKFAHDKIRQAALSFIPMTKKNSILVYMGMKLIKLASKNDLDENVFTIANLLRPAHYVLKNHIERLTVAKHFLKAGKKALTSSDFKLSVKCLETGIDLLNLNCWETEYMFSLSLYNTAAEAAYGALDFALLNKIIEAIDDNATSILHKAKSLSFYIRLKSDKGFFEDAINAGLYYLDKIGEKLYLSKWEEEFQKTKKLISGLSSVNVSTMKVMSNDVPLAVMMILNCMTTSCFVLKPQLISLVASRMVQLTISDGI